MPKSTYYSAVGGQQSYLWSTLEPREGQYDWSSLDSFIRAEAAQGKKASFAISTYDGRINNGGIATPIWVYNSWYGGDPHAIIDANGWIMPRYWDAHYLEKYGNFVRALAARYDSDVRVSWVQMGVGLYGETQPADDQDDQFTKDAMTADYGITATWEYADRWILTVNAITDMYANAFTHKPLFLMYAPTFTRACERQAETDYAASRGVGLFHAGLRPDANGVIFPPSSGQEGCGHYDPMVTWRGRVPLAFEADPFQFANTTYTYWGILSGLDKHVDYLNLDDRLLRDANSGLPIAENLATFAFANRYLGKTVSDTPSVWVALRDHRQPNEYSPGQFEDTWYPQWGNYSFWLYQDDNAPGGRTVTETNDANVTSPVYNPLIPPSKEGWITRRTDAASGNPSMSFRIDPSYINDGVNAVTITVTYLDMGQDTWALAYDATGGEKNATPLGSSNPWVQKTGTRAWKKATFVISDGRFAKSLPGNIDLRIDSRGDGNEWIHLADVARISGPAPFPTPTATGSPQPSATATTTATPTTAPVPTNTATATPTPLPGQFDTGINAGAGAYLDQSGYQWQADRAYIPGGSGYVTGSGMGTYVTTKAIKNTLDPKLYQSERFGMSAYRFDVPNGTYRIEIKLAEIYAWSIDQRRFDIKIEGQTVVSQLDIFAIAGANAAYDLVFFGPITDGQVSVEFVAGISSPKISAIRVSGVAATPVTTITGTPPTSTPTRTPTQTATRTVTAAPSNTPTTTATTTATPVVTATATQTATPTATISTPTATVTPTETATPTATATWTETPTATATMTPSATPTETATPSPVYLVRVNSGGAQYSDGSGRVWQADQAYTPGGWGYVGGQAYAVTHAIAGTADQALYQNERFNLAGYRFDVPNGRYQVTFKLAELYVSSINGRVFSIKIENQTVFPNVDVVRLAGSRFTAADLTTMADVSDGQLTIDFVASINSAKINALEVIALAVGTPTATATSGAPTATGTTAPAATSTPTASPTATTTVTATPTATNITPDTIAWRVNSGGAQYSDGSGRVWQADQAYTPGGWGYVGGQAYAVTHAIAGTADQALYQNERFNLTSYRFDVPNGRYQVTFKLAELYVSSINGRVFSIKIENQTVFPNVDVVRLAGSRFTAADLTTMADVSDGQLTIDFVASINSAKVNALEIALVPPPTATATRDRDRNANTDADADADSDADTDADADLHQHTYSDGDGHSHSYRHSHADTAL